jgi:hypothetical protein
MLKSWKETQSMFATANEAQETAACDAMRLSRQEMRRLVCGTAHEILRQCLDNGELDSVEIEEYLPRHVIENTSPNDFDYAALQQAIEQFIMSDLAEEAGKNDV